MILTQRIGDTKTHSVKLAWNGRPFVPGGAHNLIFTLKSSPDSQTDAQAKVQKQLGAGISVTGNRASVSLIPIDTAGGTVGETTVPALSPGTYYWDIQSQALDDASDIRTVRTGVLVLLRDVTRLTGASMDIYTTSPVDLFPFLEIDGGTPSSDYAGVGELDEGAP
jgi:hypothetical protein